jgi:hypothetical protein
MALKRIHPKMTRKDVRFVTATVRDATQHRVVSYTLGPSTPLLRTVVPYTLGPSTPLLRTAAPWLVPHETSQSRETEEVVPLQLLANLDRLERLVTNISMHALQHGIAAGSTVEGRIRAAADRLLSLIKQKDAVA